MAEGLREGWAPIFLADQSAHERSPTELTDIFKTVTGQSDAVAKKMATTFKAFAAHADWSARPSVTDGSADAQSGEQSGSNDQPVGSPPPRVASAGVNLHHDIRLHLPPSSDVAVYRAIFRALREELQ
jgi:hypothetical protein